MAFVPENYLMARRAIDQIGTDATAFFTNVDRAIQTLVQASSSLQGMQTEWTDAVNHIDQQAAAESGTDTKWRDLKRVKDALVTDFINMRNTAQAVRDAAQNAR